MLGLLRRKQRADFSGFERLGCWEREVGNSDSKSSLQTMRAHGDADARDHMFTATAIEEVGWLAVLSAIFIIRKALVFIF